MRYPLLASGAKGIGTPAADPSNECIKEECAWWDAVDSGQCAILSLVESLDDISVRLIRIDEDMPHAGQFSK